MENTQIQLIQKPEFKHELIALGASIKERIEGLKLSEMEVNEETIQTVKKLRAAFNNEKKQVDENFKSAISPATAIIDEIKAVKKQNVDEVYQNADSTLKDKISAFEIEIKEAKKNEVIDYFNELCAAEKIDFLKWSDLKIEINLSTTVNNYIDQVYTFVMRIGDDLLLINTMAHPAEIMTEYKKNGFNASLAISTINNRKQAEKEEAERIQLKETERREEKLRGLAMVWKDTTKTFNFVGNDDIFITQSEIKGLSNDEFTKLFVALESRIKKAKNPTPTVKEVINTVVPQLNLYGYEVQPPLPSPIEVVPVVEVKKIVYRFEVLMTLEEAQKMREFLINNKLQCKNIKL